MFDDDFEGVKYSYFNENAIIETFEGTDADQSVDLVQEYVMWNHSLADVLHNLTLNQMEIIKFKEFDWSPYPCFRHVHEFEKGKWRIPQFGNKIPLVYALEVIKKSL